MKPALTYLGISVFIPLVVGCLSDSSADEDFHPGIGVPRLSISSSQASYTAVSVGNSDQKTFTIRNIGTEPATSISTSTLSAPFSESSNTCGSTLAVGDSCTITIDYIPTNTTNASATFSVYYYSGTTRKTATLSLTGSSAAVLSAPLCVSGSVHDVVSDGTYTYVGGQFSQVGQCTGRGVPISTSSGALAVSISSLPAINGSVYVVVSDGSGGWYIGGSFTQVGGVTRNNIAHLTDNQTLDTSWNPNASSNVEALALSGTTLYVGGEFSSIGGQSRNKIAALSTSTGNATSWDPNANGSVYALAVSGSGAVVYVGGAFSSIGGVANGKLAAIDASTGSASPTFTTADDYVYTMALSGTTLYVGGLFYDVGFAGYGARKQVAALDTTNDGAATAWNADLTGTSTGVRAIAVSGSTLYIGGSFATVGGTTRNNLFAMDTSGTLSTWNPNPSSMVDAIVVSGSSVYAAGSFTSIGGASRNYIAEVDSSGNATSWNPNAGSSLFSIALYGSTIFLGGTFTTIGGEERKSLFSLDSSGNLTTWNPNVTRTTFPAVYGMAYSNSTLYIGGNFTTVGGEARNGIASFDSSGNLTTWNPSAGAGYVRAIARSGSTVYVGGGFTTIGGQSRNNLAALDASTGTATSWNPDSNGVVYSLLVSGSTIYAGGSFHQSTSTPTIGGQTRNCLVALDSTTGNATAWNPNLNSRVESMALASDSTLYVGGYFTTAGGSSRAGLASYDSSGTLTSWAPDPGYVLSLFLSGTTLYTGGYFSTIGGANRNNLAAFDTSSGNVTSWDPNTNNTAFVVYVQGGNVYAGGNFSTVGTSVRNIVALDESSGSLQWSNLKLGLKSIEFAAMELWRSLLQFFMKYK